MMLRPQALVAVLLALVVGTGCKFNLQQDLTEQEANEIYVLLKKNGIDPAKQKQPGDKPLYEIIVPANDAARAAELLRLNSLPRAVEKGLSHFDKGSMVPTATEERAMLLKALSGEVSNALNKVDGVLEARAIVMIPETNDLTQPENKPLPSASVFVKYRPGPKGEPPLKREEVQQFVATSVPELRPESVTVLLSASQPPSAEGNPEDRLQEVIGMQMTAASAGRFKVILAGVVLLVLMSIALAAFTMLKGNGAPRRARTRSPEA